MDVDYTPDGEAQVAEWSDRIVVNDDGIGANQFEPGISIAPDGRVDIA